MKYRIKFVAKNNPENAGYFVRKLKVGFKGCSLLQPQMARLMNEKSLEEAMNHLSEQGEMEYYDFTVETV